MRCQHNLRSVSLVVLVLGCISWTPRPALAKDCLDGTQAEMTECAGKMFAQADAELNDVYRQIVRRLAGNPAATTLLSQAEKTWIDLRDEDCEFANSDTVGGSVHPMTISLCREASTRTRIEYLHEFLNCSEGDMGCPVPAQ